MPVLQRHDRALVDLVGTLGIVVAIPARVLAVSGGNEDSAEAILTH